MDLGRFALLEVLKTTSGALFRIKTVRIKLILPKTSHTGLTLGLTIFELVERKQYRLRSPTFFRTNLFGATFWNV